MANIYDSQLEAYTLYHQEKISKPTAGPALPALGHALAGSTGTALSNLALYPLDLVITRLQVQRQLRKSSKVPEAGEYNGLADAFGQIYRREGGLAAFYKGVEGDVGKGFVDSFLFFLAYSYLREGRLKKQGGKATTLPVLDELSVGALAGALSKFFTTPISNIVTRKKTAAMMSGRSGGKSEDSVADIAASIRAEKGMLGFWSGYSASLVLTLNPSITFFLYEFFKRLLPRSRRDDPGARMTFLMAAVSKAIASTITYPFSLAKTRAQVSGKPPVNLDEAEKIRDEAGDIETKGDAKKVARDAKGAAKRSTVFNTILEIYRTEGAAALYEGVFGEILKGFFSHGITMIIKEAVHKLIVQTYFLILKALNKYPSPTELASQAGDILQDGAEKARELVKDGYENVTERVGNIVGDGKEALNTAGERAGVIGSNASETANSTADIASKEAGHLLGNAQEQLGDKIVEVGKGIKGDE